METPVNATGSGERDPVFPGRFAWGAATSAYQIEGAASADGKGPGVWDEFCLKAGAVADGADGRIACDHVHLVEEDVRWMRALGLPHYRFSISWPRVMPEGTGAVNAKGLAFYDRLVDLLLAAGITPWVTLFHWDLPQAFMRRGGWLDRGIAASFARYASVVAERLSDRVRHWITLNEPQCFIGFGHNKASNAPGLSLDHASCLLAGHHALLAHGSAVGALRATCRLAPRIGWSTVGVVSAPADPADPRDIAAARCAMESVQGGDAAEMGMHPNLWSNTWWNDPVFLGKYPEDGILAAGDAMPCIADGDMETISQPVDFLGTNIYTATRWTMAEDGSPRRVPHPASIPRSAFDWPIVPECLRWGPRFLSERYRIPVVVTENGISLSDHTGPDGRVRDPGRIGYLSTHLAQLRAAIDDGADVRGYFHWSLLDNFEWAAGYRQRFGLIHIDFATQRRTPKDSAWWYRDLIARHQSAAGTRQEPF